MKRKIYGRRPFPLFAGAARFLYRTTNLSMEDTMGNMGKRMLAVVLAAGMMCGNWAFADENAQLTVKSIAGVNIRMYGFIENDLINDSTQLEGNKVVEELDNPTVPKANTYAGQHHETIMSIRNSRLGFDVTMPKTEFGLATEGIFELDFLGNQASNFTPGQAPPTGQAERDFFNNPTVRVRHAYVNITYNDMWNAKIGQTWSLLGWQPYYFPSEAIVQPAVGQLYRRFSQIRGTNTLNLLGGDWTIETAIDAAKPAELGSGLTEEHAGIRFASTKYKAVSGIGSSTPMVGMSIAASAALIPVRTSGQPLTAGGPIDHTPNSNGSVVAFDALIPIIPSSDGKSTSNTLALTAEYSNGRGEGGLEVAGATGGIGAAADGTIAATGVGPLDSGIAGVSRGGNLDLIHIETYRGNLTYMWPGSHVANSVGYAATEVMNLSDYAPSIAQIPKYQYYYGNVMYLPLTWLRFALEWAQIKNTYNDVNNRHAYDNRIQFTTYLTF
jgi:hypothetical protein